MKKSHLKLLLTLAGLICFFIYANVTANTREHDAKVTILQDSELETALAKDIANAQNSIYAAMYMFKSYDNISRGAGLLKKSITDAADRGVSIYVALEASDGGDFVDTENKKTGTEFSKHGIKVVYDKPDNRMHTKCLVVDGEITYIGSHNYTNSALKYNRELTARIVSPETAKDAIRHIKSIN
ncbi:phospholipase D-like domain-containing protein [Deferribacteres bacterium DY0037]|uniref:phospholipase D-like domain-containing protein n=1 Tax=Denitrovibrio acetiphilus TaxID=118000 RepID=UPI0002F453D2|nr:phospholipase D-like domain-containing protein [Denitrovibrio acetiphilus]